MVVMFHPADSPAFFYSNFFHQPRMQAMNPLEPNTTAPHTFVPLPASLLLWCQLSSHLVKYKAEAWAFAYIDSNTNRPIGLQCAHARDIPALLKASSDSSKPEGWKALEWMDLMPDAVALADYPSALLAAMQRRRQLLQAQLNLLDQQIQTHQQNH